MGISIWTFCIIQMRRPSDPFKLSPPFPSSNLPFVQSVSERALRPPLTRLLCMAVAAARHQPKQELEDSVHDVQQVFGVTKSSDVEWAKAR